MNRVLEDERRRGPFLVGHATLVASLCALLACQNAEESAPDGEEARPVTEEVGAAAPVPEPVRPSEAAVRAERPDATDTLALTITVTDPGCLPGVCICLGAAERSTGLWRVGIENRELTDGVRCVSADFDLNGSRDLALLGGEGRVAIVMYGPDGPTGLYELDAAGLPELYEPRAEVGPRGEPASEAPGLFVPNVGQDHAVFLWSGDGFTRTLYPASAPESAILGGRR